MEKQQTTPTKNLPPGFTSWMQFYNHCIENGVNMSLLRDIKYMVKNGNGYEDSFLRICTEEIKVKCFDELISLRINEDEGRKFIDRIYSGNIYSIINDVESFDRIKNILRVMSVKK